MKVSRFQAIVYLVVGLVGINLVGADPTDVILLLLTPLLLLFRPGALALGRLDPVARLCIASFVGWYVLSLVLNSFNASFVFNFASNILLFYFLYFVATSRSSVNFSPVVIIGFFVPNVLLAGVLFGALPLPPIFFEITRDNRYLGPIGDPNLEGLFAVLVSLILVDDLVVLRGSFFAKLIKLVLLILSLFILFSTQSRSAWLAFIICAAAYLLVTRRMLNNQKLVYAGASIVLVGLVLAVTLVVSGQTDLVENRLTSLSVQESQAEEDRFKLIFTAAALRVGWENPLGVGPGLSITATGIENLDGYPVGAHNAFVQIFAENGWGAFASLVVLIIATGRRLYRQALMGQAFYGISSRVLFCGLVATCSLGMFHDLLSWRIAWLLPSLAVLSCFIRRTSGAREEQTPQDQIPWR